MKLRKQVVSLVLIACVFLLFDACVFFGVTKRCLPSPTEGRGAKTIDLDKYLPFDEKSRIYDVKHDLPLTGELPVIDGAEGLYPVFSAFVNAYYPEGSVCFDGEKFTADSKLQMNNTLRAYKAVADGDSDIIFCAAPSKEQREYAESVGAELTYVPVGREAFVFLVSTDNPVDSLSSEEIRGIYAGKYKNWKELGGKDVPINVPVRISGSGSQSTLIAFLGGSEIKRDPLGIFGSPIGFSFRFYTEDVVSAGGVKMLSVDGVYPDTENIRNGKYPIICDFYAIYRADNSNPNVKILIEAFLSEEGQEIIEKTGYSPIN